MADVPTLVPVVMCGGAGVRLWPLSRQLVPKPFVELPGGGSLLGELLASLRCQDWQTVAYVTTTAQVAACQAAHAVAGLMAPPIMLVEPVARNTGPAIAMAAAVLSERFGPDIVLAMLPADHVVTRRDVFNAAIVQAAAAAREGRLVTLGVTPRQPATGYGYIAACEQDGADWLAVNRFVEKPAVDEARRLLKIGGHYWNAGVFVATAQTFTQECVAYASTIAAAAAAAAAKVSTTGLCTLDEEIYAKLPTISFDHAVAEKSERLALVPLMDVGWSDVGTWEAFLDLLPADEQGNRSVGESLLVNSKDTRVYATSGRLAAVLGCSGITVVDTPDVVLVSATEDTQGLRKLCDLLGDDERLVYPAAERRPWGHYMQLGLGQGWKVKRIEVEPGCRLSLQSHKYRAEQWTVVTGTMIVTVGDEMRTLGIGESCVIPQGARHRMGNETQAVAVLIEVQMGSNLSEADIIRYEDDFGRA